MFDLVAIGNPVYDEIATPYVHTEGRVLSGCSTNACLAAKKLGLPKVGFVGCIGKDYEERFRGEMARYEVDLSGMKLAPTTGGFKLIYDITGNRTLDVLGVSGKILPEDIPSEYLEARVILLGPILGETSLDLIHFIREKSKALVFLDPQGMIRQVDATGRVVNHGDVEATMKYASLVDFIKPNEHEAQEMTGYEDPFYSARMMVGWGAKVGIVTLAERGSIIAKERNFLRILAYKTFAKDPTGAGDTYAGAFITKYLSGANLYHCGLFASAAASIKVEYTGPDFPLEEVEVERRVQKLFGD